MPLAYESGGDGPVLVLIHGLGHHRHAWDPLLPTLTRHRRVITVDLPGHGQSAALALESAVDLADLLAPLRQLFTELGLERPHVAGNSLGGLLALELARHGEVRSATALAPAGFWENEAKFRAVRRKLRRMRATGRLLSPLAPVICRSAIGRSLAFAPVCARPWCLSPQSALRDAAAFQSCTHFDAILENGTSYQANPQPEVPVTIAWGRRDFILPARQARIARERLPLARHVILNGCGHVPMIDNPHQVTTLLLEGSHEGS
ncbi:alpha/beta hydrolase [Actinoallomurus sp. NBC_01490]|jgi:pimeloyl-ACP methyl ester carboxylesterase|uniref:alpha/beta fold hydrolase n=1 Tax=Actinoallomurus sp. NBC_01490 TaxID=2903557 RepID=UPI002E37E2E1|nr:alpha/beta fold hydrolase [Actinoallomurus sp. NBC_01490]